MLQNEKKDLKVVNRTHEIIKYSLAGLKKTVTSFPCFLLVATLFVIELLVFIYLKNNYHLSNGMEKLQLASKLLCFLLLSLLVTLLEFYYIGRPLSAPRVNKRLIECGFVNSLGLAPLLEKRIVDTNNKKVMTWIFENNSVPISKWHDHKEDIEAALNITIIDIKYLRGKGKIELRFVNAIDDLPKSIDWKTNYLSKDDFVLSVGVGPDGLPLTINLNIIPMVLIGGATGSGKSILLKSLLMQCLNKNAEVYIADFKGGVDFPTVWHQKCHLVLEMNELDELLKELVYELESRKKTLKDSGYSNISSFNKKEGQKMKRIIFACDEIAEVLDSRGLSKDKKEIVNRIEGYLSTIARQGRAFGIHLMLSTQRPDANIIPGQIKNNCQCKICGSCDQVLSQIVLDCTDASDLIPKDQPGRFMINDTKMSIFQGYMIKEDYDII